VVLRFFEIQAVVRDLPEAHWPVRHEHDLLTAILCRHVPGEADVPPEPARRSDVPHARHALQLGEQFLLTLIEHHSLEPVAVGFARLAIDDELDGPGHTKVHVHRGGDESSGRVLDLCGGRQRREQEQASKYDPHVEGKWLAGIREGALC
jgi:hypothetical protein